MSGNTRGITRGKVKLVLDLYRAGLPAWEIAARVYGVDSRRTRQRVYSIIYLYGKRLKMLSGSRVEDGARGEVTDPESGLVLGERGFGESFVEHARPVTASSPFLGAYQNLRQLKASLKKEDVRAVNAMGFVDRLMGPLGIPHESIIREEAMLLAKRFSGRGRPKEVAAAAALASVIRHRPADVGFMMEVLEAAGVRSLNLLLVNEMLSSLG